MWFEQVLFFIAGIGALAGALGVVMLRNPFYSVLSLVTHLLSLAVLFLLLNAEFYEINLARCILCGYCEVACPFDAITMGHEHELADYNREDLIFTREMLLAEPVERTPLRGEGE